MYKKCSNFNEKIPKKTAYLKKKKNTPDEWSDTGNILLDRPDQGFHFFFFLWQRWKTELGVSSLSNSNSQVNDYARRSF